MTFSVISGPAAVSGSTLSTHGDGTIVIAADQAGNVEYLPAPQVTQTYLAGPVSEDANFFKCGSGSGIGAALIMAWLAVCRPARIGRRRGSP